MSALLPPALLLLWSGIAATALTAFVAAPLIGERAASLALAARQPSRTRALLLGTLVYPMAYAAGFATLGGASIVTGATLGLGHAALLALLTLREGGTTLLLASRGRLVLCLCYGAVLGFAYVTP